MLERASANVLADNQVTGVSDAAVLVTTESNGNRIEGNHLTEGEAGIIVETSTGNELIDNIAHDMGDSGIVLVLSGDVHCSYTARAHLPVPHLPRPEDAPTDSAAPDRTPASLPARATAPGRAQPGLNHPRTSTAYAVC